MVHEPRQDHGLSIMLSGGPDAGDWCVEGIDTGTGDHRHRVTFRDRRPMETVLHPELLACLSRVLPPSGTGPEPGAGAVEHDDPHALVQVEGLILQRLHLSCCVLPDGTIRARARFGVVQGDALRSLRDGGAFGPPIEDMTAQLYRDALNWVLLPALNIAALDASQIRTEGNDAALTGALARLHTARERLLFQVELVKRELAWLERRDPAPRPLPDASPRAGRDGGFSQPDPALPRLAAEPPQDDFATTRVLRSLG